MRGLALALLLATPASTAFVPPDPVVRIDGDTLT